MEPTSVGIRVVSSIRDDRPKPGSREHGPQSIVINKHLRSCTYMPWHGQRPWLGLLALITVEIDLGADGSIMEHRSNLVPIVVMGVLSMLLLVDVTEPVAIWLLEENHPIELASFLAAMAAAIVSFGLLRQAHITTGLARGFYVLFGAAMFFLAMEEISWGQQFFGFPTPEAWRERNTQDELTLHNYDFKGVSFLEVYPLTFAIGGLIGIALGLANLIPDEVRPPAWIWPWFVVIAGHSGLDLFHEFAIPSARLDEVVNHLDEAAEMLVALSALTYVLAKRRPA